MSALFDFLIQEHPASSTTKPACIRKRLDPRRDSAISTASHASNSLNPANMKISWCQADVDKWSTYFGRPVDVQSRVFLQNAIGGSALTMKGGNVVGSDCSVPRNHRGHSKSQVWLLVRVPRKGMLLVNESTGAHIVAKGWSEGVACTHASIDDKSGLWEIDYVDGHMTFRNKELDDCFLDMSYGRQNSAGPVFLFNGDGAKNQQWIATHLADDGWDFMGRL